MKFSIYHLSIENNNVFRGYEESKFDFTAYDKVYAGEIPGEYSYKYIDVILGTLYEDFNIRRPEDYKNRSMSVSDIIYLEKHGFFFCDSFGWKQLSL